MFCPQCGNANAVSGVACVGCGTLMADAVVAPPQPARAASQNAVNHEPADATEFYEAAIGINGGHDYYLSRFQSYDAHGGPQAGWHWPAFFVTFWWMLYRKMWRAAIIYFLAPYAATLFAVAAMALLGQTAGGALGGLVFLLYLGWAFLWIPSHAAGMYYLHCKAKIAESKQASRNEQKQLRILAAKGGSSGVVVILLMLFAVVPVVGILGAIAIPQYAEYTTRTQMKEAQRYTGGAKEAIAAHYYARHRVPSSLEEAGFTQPYPPMVGQASVGKGGVLTVVLAGQSLAGKSLVYVPALDDQQRIVWECRGEDIPVRLLPKDCRPSVVP